MHKRMFVSIIVAALVGASIAPVALARGQKPVLAPGTYKEWGPDIDEIEIVKPFKAADYAHIVIKPFDTTQAPLPDKNEKWYATLKMALASYDQAFVESFMKELKTKADVAQAESSKAPRT